MAEQNLTDDKPLIDKLYDLLLSEKQAKNFYDLANAVIGSDIEGDERADILARLYTTLNMDGRFLSVGQNFWGLKNWYPIEQQDEEVASKITPKRKRRVLEDDYEEDFDDIDDLDDFDDIDEDLDEDYDDIDDDEDIDDFDDEILDDEDFDDTDGEGPELDEDLDLEDDTEEEDLP
ncbi:MAG: DNA-directed RNA polymerase subunit delta [Tuberibacillus sp.]